MSARRAELAAGALEYVLAEGLVGLSLRPLAAALGTSDRMLVYHFGGKDALVADVVQLASDRLAGSLTEPDTALTGPGDLVRYAWRTLAGQVAGGSMRLYLELCVLCLREPGRWTAAQQRIREPWLALLRAALTELGVAAADAPTLADLVLDTLDGLLLDRMVSPDPGRADAAMAVFADLLDRSATGAGPPRGAAGRAAPVENEVAGIMDRSTARQPRSRRASRTSGGRSARS